MIDRSSIAEQMEVLTADGILVGKVEGVGSDAIKLAQQGTGPAHHFIPLDWVARVDRHVHLDRSRAELGDPAGSRHAAAEPPAPPAAAAALGAGLSFAGAGAAPIAAKAPAPAAPAQKGGDGAEGPLPPVRNPAVPGARPRRNYYLPWVLGAVLLLLLLWALLRAFDSGEEGSGERRSAARDTAPVTATRDTEGQDYAPGTIAYDLSRYLASDEPAPRTFTFDRLNFDSGSAALRQQDVGDVDQLAQVLNAHGAVRIAIIGYTDARGSGRRNARLGQARADAVVEALGVRGIDRDRLEARSGGEDAPLRSNAREGGRAENRRTELIVLSR